MAHKRNTELRTMSDEKLTTEVRNHASQLVDMRFKGAGAGAENAHVARELRRDIARIKTEMRRRELHPTEQK